MSADELAVEHVRQAGQAWIFARKEHSTAATAALFDNTRDNRTMAQLLRSELTAAERRLMLALAEIGVELVRTSAFLDVLEHQERDQGPDAGRAVES